LARRESKTRILRWIDLKARTGFAEWDSNVYYDEDMTPLLNLADFAEDDEIRTRAAMILDVMFLDMAVDSYRGIYGSSHGRSYPGSISQWSERSDKWRAEDRLGHGMFQQLVDVLRSNDHVRPIYNGSGPTLETCGRNAIGRKLQGDHPGRPVAALGRVSSGSGGTNRSHNARIPE
jgi:hypothetical protein